MKCRKKKKPVERQRKMGAWRTERERCREAGKITSAGERWGGRDGMQKRGNMD